MVKIVQSIFGVNNYLNLIKSPIVKPSVFFSSFLYSTFEFDFSINLISNNLSNFLTVMSLGLKFPDSAA